MTNIPNIVAKLEAHLSALGDSRDCKSENEKALWWATYSTTQQTISGLMNATDLAKPERQLAECEARRAAVLEKQAELDQQIGAFRDWRLAGDARQRDAEYERQRNLKIQLQLLHENRLLCAPGVMYECLGDIDLRIAELMQRIASLRARLDAHLKTAEALLLGEKVST